MDKESISREEVGIRIKKIRTDKGLNLEEFANLIDSGKSNVSKWERGRNLPNDLTVKKIAEIGNISVDELLYGDSEQRIKKVLLDNTDANDKKIGLILNYFNNIGKSYPTKEEILEEYNNLMWEVKSVVEKKVSEKMLAYSIRTAEQNLFEFINNPNDDNHIKAAIIELANASGNYETIFLKSVDEVYEEVLKQKEDI